ncbi:hypothetical protein HJFPF1_11661 [Paramyrothecium foliicola]|nr:hypothetical protein HJFPF1_11661 [Paramyrothecium foliicola]
MKLSYLLRLAPLFLRGTSGGGLSSDFSERGAITDAILAFYQSLDDKSESLMRSVTTKEFIFDGSQFAEIGLGPPVPIVGQDTIAPFLLAALNMTTSHHVSNFRIQVHEKKQANLTAYVLAHHYKQIEKLREDPRNQYIMGNKVEASVIKDKGKWKLNSIKLLPFWQSGNTNVMGLS